MKQKFSDGTNKIIIGWFIVLISLPLIGNVLGIKTNSQISENTRVQAMPALELRHLKPGSLKTRATTIYIRSVEFIKQFDSYFSNTFSFRMDLLILYNGIKANVLLSNPIPHKVVKGDDGWLFIGDSYSNAIKECKGIERFSEVDLNATLDETMKRKKWLNGNGIQFYLALAPDKLSVYGDRLAIRKSSKSTMREQLDSAAVGKIELIDLRSTFSRPHKVRLFHKTDSHWNEYGAFLAYSSLMSKIKSDFTQVRILSLSDFSVDSTVSFQQDLTKMLGIRVKEHIVRLTSKRKITAVVQKNRLSVPTRYSRSSAEYEQRYKSNANDLKVLIFRDSFSSDLIKYLNESFGETVFIWRHQFNKSLIEQEKPDMVIQILVERDLELLIL